MLYSLRNDEISIPLSTNVAPDPEVQTSVIRTHWLLRRKNLETCHRRELAAIDAAEN